MHFGMKIAVIGKRCRAAASSAFAVLALVLALESESSLRASSPDMSKTTPRGVFSSGSLFSLPHRSHRVEALSVTIALSL